MKVEAGFSNRGIDVGSEADLGPILVFAGVSAIPARLIVLTMFLY